MDRKIIKFCHCQRSVYRFSIEPGLLHDDFSPSTESELNRCPICSETLSFSLLDAPVGIPCPFVNGHNVPCSFTIGSIHGPLYLGEWHDTELHVGVTDSSGMVYNYTSSGLRRDVTGWEKCLCLPLVPPWRENFRLIWDRELQQYAGLPMWTPERFHEEREHGSCCYGFALAFINHMRDLEGKEPLGGEEFTGMLILPRVKTISKYIRVYQEIEQNGCYIAEQNEI